MVVAKLSPIERHRIALSIREHCRARRQKTPHRRTRPLPQRREIDVRRVSGQRQWYTQRYRRLLWSRSRGLEVTHSVITCSEKLPSK
jgi:hypothetical protein